MTLWLAAGIAVVAWLTSRALPAVPMPGSVFSAVGLGLASAAFPLAWSIHRRTRFPLERMPWVVVWCLAARLFFDAFMRWKATIALSGFPWDARLAALDSAVHGGPAWQLLPTASWLLRLGDAAYYIWFPVLTAGILAWAWHPDAAKRHRMALAFVLIWVVGGIVTARVLASAGPIFAGGAPVLPAGLTTLSVRDALWGAYQAGQATSISAMPSMHVAIPVLYAMGAGRNWMRWVLTGYTGLILLASIGLGWHYAVDGYTGILLAFGCWWIAGKGVASRNTSSERDGRHQ